MDLRDFGFWVSEAKRRKLAREADAMEMMRLAMWAETDRFSSLLQEMRASLMTPEQRRATQDRAWLSLKTIGRG